MIRTITRNKTLVIRTKRDRLTLTPNNLKRRSRTLLLLLLHQVIIRISTISKSQHNKTVTNLLPKLLMINKSNNKNHNSNNNNNNLKSKNSNNNPLRRVMLRQLTSRSIRIERTRINEYVQNL